MFLLDIVSFFIESYIVIDSSIDECNDSKIILV